ncbi:rho GTPase-activating protein gacF isoform X2 [Topomyia yanbarensis]|uniref:rho GTPase-activating protein gacF isoform X2 n=1 Tax=Topomyia yanbarensis TaxID=2498891 RepID=UPI00273A9B2A|nr:rho GTPase-activating protein gacF isoform X2 [Topomyia yanbarensis]
MVSGRLRRRALALLGALLLVIFIWPPCCATMPKPLPALLPAIPEIDLPSEPMPAVAVVSSVQQNATGKSRKASDVSRLMNIFSTTTTMVPSGEGTDEVRSGETGGRGKSATHSRDVSSANANDNQGLNLRRHENNSAGSSIEESIDKNKSHEQQTSDGDVALVAQSAVLDNVVVVIAASESEKPYRPQPKHQPEQITHSPTIFSILFQKPPTPARKAINEEQVNDRGYQSAVNQSVFNLTSSDGGDEDDRSIISPTFTLHYSHEPVVLSRVERSAMADPAEFPYGASQHRHRHQHYLTGNSTLTAAVPASGRGRGGIGRHHHHHHHHHLQHQSHQQQHQQQQQQYRNGTTTGAGGSDDSSNLERNERSANLSHITGATRKIQLYIKNRYLQLLPDGTVNGTHDDQSDFTILQRTTVAAGQIRIQSVATCLFLCMDTCGTVYGSKDFTDDCVFNEQIEQHHYNTYSSTQHSNARRTLYLALNKTGQPRKIQIPINRTLGKLATYTKALTQTVAHDRVERLISRLFGPNHVRHGLKQLCESGKALQDLTAKVMRPRPACGSARNAIASQPAASGGAKETNPPATPGGNKDKDTKDTLRKKKKKRRKCREDEPAGEHCFRPLGGSIGTNSGRRRSPGPAKSQRCSSEDGDCAVSPSSSSGSSSSSSSSSSIINSGSPNSANSVRISSSNNRANTTPANVPNVVASASVPGSGPKKKLVKKVNNRNTPNVNNKKPKKGPGNGGGGSGPNKKAKQLQNTSSSSSINSSSLSSSSSSVPSAVRGRGKTTSTSTSSTTSTPIKTTITTTTTRTTAESTSVTTPAIFSSSPSNNLEETSQSEDELEAELDMDDLLQGSIELIEEDDIDEGNLNLAGQSLNFVDEDHLGDMDF